MIKRSFDLLVACVGLTLLAPVFVLLALLIKIESKGPVFFAQTRMGQGFRKFSILKFRTMIDRPVPTGGLLTIGHDSRVTRIGNILRRVKLDELPQLINVIKGEMSLVGPRPEVPQYVDMFRNDYEEVLETRPGLVDLASLKYIDEQMMLGHVANPEEEYVKTILPDKIRLAKVYVAYSSFLLDLVILVQASFKIFGIHDDLLIASPQKGQDEILLLPNSSLRKYILTYRRQLIVGLDVGLIVVANYLAFLLRFDGYIPSKSYQVFFQMLPVLLLVRTLSFSLFRLNEGLWRYIGIWDVKNIIWGVLSGTLCFFLIVHFGFGFTEYPRSVFVIDSMLLISFLVGIRLVVRLFRKNKTSKRSKRVLIIGAGKTGEKIVREMQEHPSCAYSPIGFVDDDPLKVGQRIHGIKVLATSKDLPKILALENPAEILIAISQSHASSIRNILRTLEAFKIPIKTLPKLEDILDGKVTIGQIRDLKIEDLLQRPPVGTPRQILPPLIQGKRIMVTGAGGSIGSELCRQIIAFDPQSLVLYERHENSLYQIASELADNGYSARTHEVLGDITDPLRLKQTLEHYRPEIIFHAAAHKHVPLMELNPCEAFKNNIIGTHHVAKAAEHAGVDRFVLISTDKAVNPSSVMGATKRGAELVVRSLAQTSQTCFLIVRFGNVLGSNGSVVPRFQKQIRGGGPVTVTHPDVRRYFMTIPEAVELVLQAATLKEQSALYVLDMGQQIKLLDLARHLIRLSGYIPEKEIPIQFVGLRPGEKLEEELVADGENSEHSPIDKIFQIKSHAAQDFTQLNQILDDFLDRIHLNSPLHTLAQLQKLVPTFHHIELPGKDQAIDTWATDSAQKNGHTKTVLVVDDDESARSATRALLENSGYTCIEAEHGVKALELLRQDGVDLIVTDNRMPKLTGLDFIEQLQQSEPANRIPLIIFSGNLSHVDKERALKAGAYAALDKPDDLARLTQTIHEIFIHKE
ncbi:SDR family NAD(P)-dependent oxidoreductase [Nitrospira sp. M1]